LLKSTISQQVERMKTNDISQWVEVDTTTPSPVASISFRISLDVTMDGDHVTALDAEDTDGDAELFVAIAT